MGKRITEVNDANEPYSHSLFLFPSLSHLPYFLVLDSVSFKGNEGGYCLAFGSFASSPPKNYLIVGTASDEVDQEGICIHGRIILYEIRGLDVGQRQLRMVHSMDLPGAVFSLVITSGPEGGRGEDPTPREGYAPGLLMAGVGDRVVCFRWHELEERLELISSLGGFTQALSLSAPPSGAPRCAVGDMMWGASLVRFDPLTLSSMRSLKDCGTLIKEASDNRAIWTTAMALAYDSVVFVGDMEGNVQVIGLPTLLSSPHVEMGEGSHEEMEGTRDNDSLGKMDPLISLSTYHLGQQVNRIIPGKLLVGLNWGTYPLMEDMYLYHLFLSIYSPRSLCIRTCMGRKIWERHLSPFDSGS